MVSRPNVLLVVFDRLSAEALQRLSASLPTLAALQKGSTNFQRAYACSPQSGPARASLFTGVGMAAHGVWRDGITLPIRETTIAEVLKRNGYTTWLVGRRQLAGVASWTTEHARPHEYHHFDWAHGPLHRSRQNAYLTWLKGTAPDTYAHIFPSQANPDDTEIPDWQRAAMAALPDALSFNTWLGAQMCTRLTEHANEGPFLGIAGFVVGESMGADDGSGLKKLDERALQQADTALAKVLADLPAETIVVVTSGRGAAGDHPMQERSINVPLSIRTPNGSAQSIKAPVSTMDIAPTLYRIAQITPPQRIQGTCLLNEPARGWALSRLRSAEASQHTALCAQQFKLVMSQASAGAFKPPTYRLYDLQADPHDANDLAADPAHAQDLDDMIDLMIDARVALEDRTEPRIAMF